jgi:hypothetical protein
MGIMYYSSFLEYMRTCRDIKSRIAAIDSIISALYAAAAEAAAGENVTQYSLNDGQTIISATPRSSKSITESITAWEVLRNREVQKLTGRVTRLVDGKNFTGRNGC